MVSVISIVCVCRGGSLAEFCQKVYFGSVKYVLPNHSCAHPVCSVTVSG